MVDDFKKDNSADSSNMNFEDESSNAPDKTWFESKQPDNPFEKNENPFADDPGKTEYQVSNEAIESNRQQSNNLAKVLLALLLSVGLLVAAIWGLVNKKQNPSAPTASTQAVVEQTPTEQTQPQDVAKSPVDTKIPPKLACRIDEAQKYIATSVNDLDRVTSKVEVTIEELLNSDQTVSPDQVNSLRNKVEGLSRAESDIRAFSEPHIEKDISVSFKEFADTCKIKEGPQYISAWLDDLKERISNLNTQLDDLGGEANTSTAAVLPSSDKPIVALKAKTTQSSVRQSPKVSTKASTSTKNNTSKKVISNKASKSQESSPSSARSNQNSKVVGNTSSEKLTTQKVVSENKKPDSSPQNKVTLEKREIVVSDNNTQSSRRAQINNNYIDDNAYDEDCACSNGDSYYEQYEDYEYKPMARSMNCRGVSY